MKNIVNIINFIRDIEPRPWRHIDLAEPVREQICLLRQYNLKGTFLLQYDALLDKIYVDLMKGCQDICEIGLWLEIVQPLVEKVGLAWKGRYPWDWHNDVGFLVGYEPDERIHLVDEAMEQFRETFGAYPQVVGSWHMDAISVAHLEQKYHIKACCMCREQVGTDGYTLAGGYYNQAYYPSKHNIFCPAQTKEMQISVPMFRMLGSDPIHAYDYGIKNYPLLKSVGVTLEPTLAGGYPQYCDWFFDEVFDGNGISFQYTQVGQENSFGWPEMKDGITYQFSLVRKLLDEGKIELMTLSESGEWYRKHFAQTPACSYTAFREYLEDGDRKAVWYYNTKYRTGLFWENGVVYFRDMYVFDEMYPEKYLKKRCETHACEFRNLPVMDATLFTDTADMKSAGIYIKSGEDDVVWKHFSYTEGVQNIIINLENDTTHAKITCSEDGIDIWCDQEEVTLCFVANEDAVYGKKRADAKRYSNVEQFVLTAPTEMIVHEEERKFIFDNISYGIRQQKKVCEGGWHTSLRIIK